MQEFGRFRLGGRTFYAAVEGNTAIEWPDGPFAVTGARGAAWPLDDLVILPPTEPVLVVEVTVGPGNGGTHPSARMRLRAASTLIPHRAMVPLPRTEHRISAHPMLALVVGRHTHRVDADGARDAILGWATAVALQDDTRIAEDPGAAAACNHAGFLAIGPAVRVGGALPTQMPTLRHNGRLIDAPAPPAFDAAALLAEASDWAAFAPGDLMLIGTERAGAAVRPGDHMEIACPSLRSVALNVGSRGSA